MPCVNLWWKDCCNPCCNGHVVKGFFLRLLHGIYSVLVTAKKHMVYIPFGIGLTLVIVGQWLIAESNRQEQFIVEPLTDIDVSIDDLIDGLNFVTQNVPNDVLSFVQNGTDIMTDEVNGAIQDGMKGSQNTLNELIDTILLALNRAIDWGETLRGVNIPPITTIGWTPMDVSVARIPSDWNNFLPSSLDLSAIRVPSRAFSVHAECAPFVKNVYDVPREIAQSMIIVGLVLLVYACVRLFLALIWPFVPVHKSTAARCTTAVFKSGSNVVSKILKPHIHVPLIVGAVLILIAVFILLTTAEFLEEHMLDPVREVDGLLRILYNEYNEFVLALPVELIDDANDLFDDAVGTTRNEATTAYGLGLTSINTWIGEFELDLARTFTDMGLPTIPLPRLDLTALQLTLPEADVPDIPIPELDALLIPADEWSLEKELQPWADEQVTNLRDTARTLITWAVIIMFFPTLSVLTTALKPFFEACFPKFFKWLDHPGFHSEGGAGGDDDDGGELGLREPATPASPGAAAAATEDPPLRGRNKTISVHADDQ